MFIFETVKDKKYIKKVQRKAFKKLSWIYIIMSLLLITFGILAIVFKDNNNDVNFGISIIVFGCLFAPICIGLSMFINFSITKASPYIGDDVKVTLTFDEEAMNLEIAKVNSFENGFKVIYDFIKKVIVEKNSYIIYTTNTRQYYILDKSCLVQGTTEDFESFLKDKIGPKLIYKNWDYIDKFYIF